jgi:poly-beta-1,6-N-acetyl-D-glucosamine synthase
MLFWKYVFWISCFIVFYNYAGYAIIVVLLNKFRNKKTSSPKEYYPSISFIVAAYNEEECIEQKIINSLQQIYPAGNIEFIFITDGSSDATSNIVSKYSNITLLHSNERKGKTAALNRAVEIAQNEILIFSDANTILNKHACLNISKHYFDKSVGGVAGEKKVIPPDNGVENAAKSEGLYWKYESVLKKIDSDFHSVVGAAGELFSIKKDLYQPVSSAIILDDFVISMKVAQKGYRFIYEPNAFAMELPSFSMQDERKRKVRIAAGGFQAMAMLPDALFFWKHPKLSFLYISHRVLRWTLSPLCLIFSLLSNFILTVMSFTSIYSIIFLAQTLFYIAAFFYWLSPSLGKKFPVSRLVYYFTFMNISVYEGFLKFIRRKQSSAWEKAKRTNYVFSEAEK